MELASGLLSAAGSAYQAYQQQKAFKSDISTPEGQKQFFSNYPGSPEEAAQAYERIGRANYYMNRGGYTQDNLADDLGNMTPEQAEMYVQSLAEQGIIDYQKPSTKSNFKGGLRWDMIQKLNSDKYTKRGLF
jgi:hypothetical protein